MKAKILWIEGKRTDQPSFLPGLRGKGYTVETVRTGAEAVKLMQAELPNLVVINAVSIRTSGRGICRTIRQQFNGLPILLITEDHLETVADAQANEVLRPPFTLRKLVNRITPLLPCENEKTIEAGPIRLCLGRRIVRSGEKETRLNPRLTQLLQILMEHHGEVMERQRLFRDLWETDYTGDTRTLDVHIRWLREAIEEDPRHPQLLKTVRGVGYRLDI